MITANSASPLCLNLRRKFFIGHLSVSFKGNEYPEPRDRSIYADPAHAFPPALPLSQSYWLAHSNYLTGSFVPCLPFAGLILGVEL